jgi:LPXTG-motif cell wall-anchored protein
MAEESSPVNRRLPVVLLSAATLVVLPAAAASATGGHHWSGGSGHSASWWKGKDKPGQPDRCVSRNARGAIDWSTYACDRATGYFLYQKLDASKPANWANSGQQHRVALHDVWAWPTADDAARHGASGFLPKDAEVRELVLDAADTAAVCAAPGAFGLQVDLIGNGKDGERKDLTQVMPTVITPPNGGFSSDNLAAYGHYDLTEVVDVTALCTPPAPRPEPTPEPTPEPEPSVAPEPEPSQEPTPEPTPSEDVDDAPTPEPSPEPTERAEVLPAPADTPTPAASPTPTERAEVLSATDDDTLAATGTQAALGLLAGVAAIAGGAALVLARRRHRSQH